MPTTPDPTPSGEAPFRLGVDAGASLVKLAIRDAEGRLRLETAPASELDQVAQRIASTRPQRVALTGGGAPRLERLLDSDTARVPEFDAWASGARVLLRERGEFSERFLLVSVGTGTSAMLVEAEAVHRVGGTALGGGTILGLGAALTGTASFERIALLAARGDRRRVDLLVSDIYPEGDFSLPGEVNAASFAKLALTREADGDAAVTDLAHGIMGLVGENVALICTGLAAACKVDHVVFGGSTLRDNPTLEQILSGACRALGGQPTFLEAGEFVGALGALAITDAAEAASEADAARR